MKMKMKITLLTVTFLIAAPSFLVADEKNESTSVTKERDKESVSITKDRDGWKADYSDGKHTDYHPKGNTYQDVKEIYNNQGVKVEPSRSGPGKVNSK